MCLKRVFIVMSNDEITQPNDEIITIVATSINHLIGYTSFKPTKNKSQ